MWVCFSPSRPLSRCSGSLTSRVTRASATSDAPLPSCNLQSARPARFALFVLVAVKPEMHRNKGGNSNSEWLILTRNIKWHWERDGRNWEPVGLLKGVFIKTLFEHVKRLFAGSICFLTAQVENCSELLGDLNFCRYMPCVAVVLNYNSI